MGSGKVNGRLRSPGNHDALLRRIASDLLGWRPNDVLAKWIPSDESDVFEISVPETTARIVKVERDDMWCVRREELAFPALRDRGFWEFPEVEYATSALDDPPAPFIVMPKSDWRPWQDLWDEDRQLAVWAVERIGDFLRRLGQVDWRDIPGVITPSERIASFADWFATFFRPLLADSDFADVDRQRIHELLEAMRQPPRAFGGWQFAQVLTDGRSSFVAIDWGNLGAYWPLHDLAAAVVSLDQFGDGAAVSLRPYLLDAFTAGRAMTAEEQHLLTQWLDLWEFFARAATAHATA